MDPVEVFRLYQTEPSMPVKSDNTAQSLKLDSATTTLRRCVLGHHTLQDLYLIYKVEGRIAAGQNMFAREG